MPALAITAHLAFSYGVGFLVLRMPLPSRRRGLGQEPVLRHVLTYLSQRVSPLGRIFTLTALDPLDPLVEVGQAADVRGHARLDRICQPLQLRQVVQLDGMFGLREDLA